MEEIPSITVTDEAGQGVESDQQQMTTDRAEQLEVEGQQEVTQEPLVGQETQELELLVTPSQETLTFEVHKDFGASVLW